MDVNSGIGSRLKRVARRVKYFGFRWQCPLCGSKVRTLHPGGHEFPVLAQKRVIGAGVRPHCRCPVCKATDRERLLYLLLSQRTELFSLPAQVLHVAPERELGALIRTKTNLDYLSADLRSKNVMANFDITNIPLENGSFDVLICNHVLEHIVDDAKALDELYRVLRTGGWGILQVPIMLAEQKTDEDPTVVGSEERKIRFGQSDHVRIYAIDYVERLKLAGFTVQVFEWWLESAEHFGGSLNRYGLIENEPIFLVKK